MRLKSFELLLLLCYMTSILGSGTWSQSPATFKNTKTNVFYTFDCKCITSPVINRVIWLTSGCKSIKCDAVRWISVLLHLEQTQAHQKVYTSLKVLSWKEIIVPCWCVTLLLNSGSTCHFVIFKESIVWRQEQKSRGIRALDTVLLARRMNGESQI